MRQITGALDTLNHNVDYARSLVRGNRFAGDMSWLRPGSAPVVLVHGFLGTRGTMLPLTRRFQGDGRAVFSYSHGPFQLRSLRASAETLLTQLHALSEELHGDRVDVVGFSMGGLMVLQALQFMQGHRYIRRLALLGVPLLGTWTGLAGVAAFGLVSPSVWQVLPNSRFLAQLRDGPIPPSTRVRQIYASDDALCPVAPRLEGVASDDYLVLPGGHSSLVVAQPFYAKVREFLDGADG